jgi:thiol-disulfide isomerase/thioredoxin
LRLPALGCLLLAAASPSGVPVVKTVDEALALEAPGHDGLRVLHFWALWCSACKREMPEVRQLAARLDATGVPFLGVSLDAPGQTDAVAAYAREQRLGFPNAILDAPDPTPVTERLAPGWDASLPATFIVAKSGKTLRAYLGPTPVERVLDDVRHLAEKARQQEKRP